MSGEPQFTKGPWSWFGSTYSDGSYYLATTWGGRRYVQGFRRSGLNSAQPTFQVNSIMVPASDLVLFDVDRTVKGKEAGKKAGSVYRYDFSMIDHPDACLIAAAPELYTALNACLGLLTGNMDGELPHDSDPAEMARAALAKARGEQP